MLAGVNRGRDWIGRKLRMHQTLRIAAAQLFYVLTACALGLAVPRVPIGFGVRADRAVEALVSVGIGIFTFIGVVYSLLFLVLQFAATTFTPRLHLFRDSPIVWNAFGYFTGILVFSFTSAFSIGDSEELVSGLVPITLALLLVVALVVFRHLQSAALRSIQLASTLDQVAARGRAVIHEVYSCSGELDDAEEPAGVPGFVIRWPRNWAVLQLIDAPRLVRRAQAADVVVTFRRRPGETLFEGEVLAEVSGSAGPEFGDKVLVAARSGRERTFDQDPLLAFRVLADIAVRALSPAVNDPTTAVDALDAIDSLLRPLAQRSLDGSRIRDTDGRLRLIVPVPSWPEFISTALDEVLPLVHSSTHVRLRMQRLLEELAAAAPPSRRQVIHDRLRVLAA
jgi:uncharacterized membrane protein